MHILAYISFSTLDSHTNTNFDVVAYTRQDGFQNHDNVYHRFVTNFGILFYQNMIIESEIERTLSRTYLAYFHEITEL